MRYRRSDTGVERISSRSTWPNGPPTPWRNASRAWGRSMGKVKAAHPFSIVAMMVLPEHLHAIWRLHSGDADYPMRWSC